MARLEIVVSRVNRVEPPKMWGCSFGIAKMRRCDLNVCNSQSIIRHKAKSPTSPPRNEQTHQNGFCPLFPVQVS